MVAALGARVATDMPAFLANEAGLMSADIARAVGPKTLEKGEIAMGRVVKSQLTTYPGYYNISEDHAGDGNWVMAGKTFLVRIDPKDDLINADGATALAAFRAREKSGATGSARISLGRRGKQHCEQINRIRVSEEAAAFVRWELSKGLGKLKASFAFTASDLNGTHFPEWVTRHFGDHVGGRAVLEKSTLTIPEFPSIRFGSRARGVESNPKVEEKIQGVIRAREIIIGSKLSKIIKGWSFNQKTGAVFQPAELN